MLSNAVLLFLVIDPFGLIPIYLSLIKRVPPERRIRVLLRELAIALVALVLFLFAGKYMLALLRISESSLAISGGLILFLIALPMVFPAIKLGFDTEDSAEPFIVPLATPLFAGPSALTLVILIGNDKDGAWPERLAAVFAAWLAAGLVLLLGNAIARLIGARGLVALERLMGMFLVAMAVEMLLSGLAAYFRALPS
ncbi:MAG TPA: MarC family protein [Gammaproteobacteria bacterium]|nr:MarC family protein [Gammaproteobacteria bacterium]